MFRRRIGGVVVVVEYGLGERAKKTLFTQEKNFAFQKNFALIPCSTTRVRYRLAYPEDEPFPICL
jgi:hypothetical protein